MLICDATNLTHARVSCGRICAGGHLTRDEWTTMALERARRLLTRAFDEAPDKSRPHVFLECARVEELAMPGKPSNAREILDYASIGSRGEWKVFLEAVMLERRAGRWKAGADRAIAALAIHPGSSR